MTASVVSWLPVEYISALAGEVQHRVTHCLSSSYTTILFSDRTGFGNIAVWWAMSPLLPVDDAATVGWVLNVVARPDLSMSIDSFLVHQAPWRNGFGRSKPSEVGRFISALPFHNKEDSMNCRTPVRGALMILIAMLLLTALVVPATAKSQTQAGSQPVQSLSPQLSQPPPKKDACLTLPTNGNLPSCLIS